MTRWFAYLILVASLAPLLHTQEPVAPAKDVDALFTSPDPKLQSNKRVVYGIYKDLLEAGHWELSNQYLTDRYIQHNPNAASGRDGVVKFFTCRTRSLCTTCPRHLFVPRTVSTVTRSPSARTAEVLKVQPKPISSRVTSTWRIKDGKADEHWDCATR